MIPRLRLDINCERLRGGPAVAVIDAERGRPPIKLDQIHVVQSGIDRGPWSAGILHENEIAERKGRIGGRNKIKGAEFPCVSTLRRLESPDTNGLVASSRGFEVDIRCQPRFVAARRIGVPSRALNEISRDVVLSARGQEQQLAIGQLIPKQFRKTPLPPPIDARSPPRGLASDPNRPVAVHTNHRR